MSWQKYRIHMVRFVILTTMAATTLVATAQNQPATMERLERDTTSAVHSRLKPILDRYCFDSCEIVNVDLTLEEELSDTEDLGFESSSSRLSEILYKVTRVRVEIQIDDRVTVSNRDRLLRILQNHLRDFGMQSEVIWRPVTLPNIGRAGEGERQQRANLESRLNKSIADVIAAYCPEQCLIAQINIEGQSVSLDEARGLPGSRAIVDPVSRSAFRVDDVSIEISMDEALAAEERQKIANVLRAKTRFVSPVNINITTTPFPEPYAQLREKMRAESQDPYGLEKLRRMLVMFRELAGTKEIITNSSSTNNSESNSQSSETSSRSDRSTLNSATQAYGESGAQEWLMYGLIGLFVAGLLIALIMRVMGANQDAKALMMQSMPTEDSHRVKKGDSTEADQNHEAYSGESTDDSESSKGGSGKLRLQCEELRRELVQVFIDSPKVARETFGRLLKEDGVEETAKYVHILGHMVIFELLEDPQLQRDLYELSEYYHNSGFDFTLEDKYELLQSLRTKATASEIRILSRKSMDKFDFLAKLDSEQIYNLIGDENPQVQSIVLTQLDKKRRMAVFNMYQGESRMKLMGQLCRADAIPKDYLSNVANALAKKIQGRPEFDTENLRSSDILLDLMERADLDEQRKLMDNLQSSNADAARGLKMRLVTIEMLPYLKDGHLLEMIMGMEREDLLNFLMGTRDHVRDLLLNKAPSELAESWMEDLRYMASVDDQAYRLVEMKVLSRVRQLASNGAISILDLNELIFSTSLGGEKGQVYEESSVGELSSSSMVA